MRSDTHLVCCCFQIKFAPVGDINIKDEEKTAPDRELLDLKDVANVSQPGSSIDGVGAAYDMSAKQAENSETNPPRVFPKGIHPCMHN
jgi:hypothetical protein